MRDYYYLLGVSEESTIDEIKTAYRKLSLKFHPDQNNGDKFFEERFKDINEAYEELSKNRITCPRCFGKGYISLFDGFGISGKCRYCDGIGTVDRSMLQKVDSVDPLFGLSQLETDFESGDEEENL